MVVYACNSNSEEMMRQEDHRKFEATLGCLTKVMHTLTKGSTSSQILNPPLTFYFEVGTQLAKTSVQLHLCPVLVLNPYHNASVSWIDLISGL